MAGEPFQEWLHCSHDAWRLSKGNSSSVDNSSPDVLKVDVGVVVLEHRPGTGVEGVDVPVGTLPSPLPSVLFLLLVFI